jgi:hypothetical protein
MDFFFLCSLNQTTQLPTPHPLASSALLQLPHLPFHPPVSPAHPAVIVACAPLSFLLTQLELSLARPYIFFLLTKLSLSPALPQYLSCSHSCRCRLTATVFPAHPAVTVASPPLSFLLTQLSLSLARPCLFCSPSCNCRSSFLLTQLALSLARPCLSRSPSCHCLQLPQYLSCSHSCHCHLTATVFPAHPAVIVA